MKVELIPNITRALGNVSKVLVMDLEKVEIREWSQHPKYSIIEIGQNIMKYPGDLRRLAVAQTLVKDISKR